MTAICSICQEKLQSGRSVALSRCGHVLCGACLLQWAQQNNPPTRVECPMCRSKHTYPKNTTKLFFEEERSEAEGFRSEIMAVLRLIERCADEPTGASLAGIVNALRGLADGGKNLGEQVVTTAAISGLDAMVNHLSKKLGPIQSTEDLHARLTEAQENLDNVVRENIRLTEQAEAVQIRHQSLAVELAAVKGSLVKFRTEHNHSKNENQVMREQLAEQRRKNIVLQQQLSACKESRDDTREKFVALKKKYKTCMESNEALKVQVNRALAERRTASPSSRPTPLPSTSRLTRRPSIISIHSQSSPDGKHVSLTSSDDDGNPASESSDIELISDTESHDDPMPVFHELKLKPVKSPAALFKAAPQASSSRPAPSKSVQKRKLAATLQAPQKGLELRNGKLTGLVMTGPKRTRKA